jgi:acyl carrier protein
MNEGTILETIQKALDAPVGSITLESSSENTESWDSLGHLSILVALDKIYDGKISEINELADADSSKKIIDVLRNHSLI